MLQESHVRVPESIALVGFDDLPVSPMFDPFLTVVRQPAYEMGLRAAELLLARLAGTAPRAYQELILPTEVEIHRSSGPPIPALEPAALATAG
jgi:LacI family transcriptional regulator